MRANFDLRQLRVMVVENNRHVQEILRTQLRGLGVGAIEIHACAEKAYARLVDFVPDFAMVDLELDGSGGLEFIRQVRRNPESSNPFLPIIVVSAHGDRVHVTQARDIGATGFLVKPVSARSLYDRIVDIIEHPRSFVRAPNYVGPCRRRRPMRHDGLERRSAAGKKLEQAQNAIHHETPDKKAG